MVRRMPEEHLSHLDNLLGTGRHEDALALVTARDAAIRAEERAAVFDNLDRDAMVDGFAFALPSGSRPSALVRVGIDAAINAARAAALDKPGE